MKERAQERELLARQLADADAQVEATRERLATGETTTLCAPGALDRHALRLFPALLGEALAARIELDAAIERPTSDVVLRVRLEPVGTESFARIETERGTFSGRDHRLTITNAADASEAEPA